MKPHFRLGLIAVLLAAMLPAAAIAQQTKDETEAAQIARQFSRRLRRTQDMDPLIRDFFIDDFIERSLKEQNHWEYGTVKTLN